MLELIYDEELGFNIEVYRAKETAECALLCRNNICIIKKLYAKENGIYMDLKCQFRQPNMSDCPDYQSKEKKDNGKTDNVD